MEKKQKLMHKKRLCKLLRRSGFIILKRGTESINAAKWCGQKYLSVCGIVLKIICAEIVFGSETQPLIIIFLTLSQTSLIFANKLSYKDNDEAYTLFLKKCQPLSNLSFDKNPKGTGCRIKLEFMSGEIISHY